MKNRSLIVLATLSCAVGGLLVTALSRNSREPVYEGRRLSDWTKALDYYNRGQPGFSERDARRAVREAGTNAVPTLLRMLQASDSPLKVRLMNLFKKQHFINLQFSSAESRHRQAEAAFNLLGPRASGAVPELMKIYSNSPSADVQAEIAQMLGELGPLAKDAVPMLRRATGSSNISLQVSASNALQLVAPPRNSYDPVGQSLMTRLNDHLAWQQAEGARMIFAEGFGSPARFAKFAPVIEGLLRQNRENSYWLLFALDYLDPDAAAKFMTNSGKAELLRSTDPADINSGGLPGARLLGAGDWSHTLADSKFNKLRARLLVYGPSHYTNNAGEWWGESTVEIELQDCNTTMAIAPTAIYFDGKNALQLELRDAHGNVIAPVSNGGDTNTPQWISVPFDGTVRFRVDAPVPASHTKPDGLNIRIGGGACHIAGGDTNIYVLSGTFTPSTNHSNLLDYQAWSGTLDLPGVKFGVPKP